MEKALLTEYKESLKELNKFDKERNKVSEEINKNKNAVWDKFYKLKDELQQKERKEKQKVEDTEKKLKNEISEKEKPFFEIKNKVIKILDFIDIIVKEKKRELNFEIVNSSYGRERELYNLKTLKKNDFLNVKVCIAGNNKPKNKYSLVVVGRSIFNEKFVDFPKSYSLPISLKEGYETLGKMIKESPSVDELKNYFEKVKDKILIDFFQEHDNVEKEFVEVKETYFKENKWLLLYWNHRKNYYETCYSRGTETEEYKEVLKKIKELSKK